MRPDSFKDTGAI